MMRDDVVEFEAHRGVLLMLAYRMLGDFGRAEDMVQEAWIRWQRRGEAAVDSPKAFLLKIVTRLCLNELDSARARKEESRGDRLPEPIDLDDFGADRVELLDQVSMAFLVLLQRLTPAERAVLLLHEVFAQEHAEIAALLGKTEAASRQLLRRAREHVAVAQRTLSVSKEEHRRLLHAFLAAAGAGDMAALEPLLAEDVMLVADAGPEGGVYGRVRNLPGPVRGRVKVAAFVAAAAPQGTPGLEVRERELNGQPAIVLVREGRPYAVLMVAVAGGQIASIFMHADAGKLSHLGTLPAKS
jgi:RNA polymerase sigma-70 factor (ECF subfamily)